VFHQLNGMFKGRIEVDFRLFHARLTKRHALVMR
jgi:hypothetical protein